eukprot:UN00636
MNFDEEDENNSGPFDGNAWIYDCMNDHMAQKCLVKTKKCVNLVPLTFSEENEDGNHNNSNANKQVRGAKGLEENGFSCGILEIPPGSQKDPETSFFTEQFFVHHCEKKILLFKVGNDDEFYLSTGTMFFVPPENEYELINLSKTHPVPLIFTLIKKDNQMDDNDTQISNTQNTTTQNTPRR